MYEAEYDDLYLNFLLYFKIGNNYLNDRHKLCSGLVKSLKMSLLFTDGRRIFIKEYLKNAKA